MESTAEESQKNKHLTFYLADEKYGIQVEQVTEIIGNQQITAVPDLPQHVRGVINLRGQIIPVMDVRQRFCLQVRA